MKEPGFEKIAELIVKTIKNGDDEKVLDEVKGDVRSLCEKFPLYEDLG